MIAVYLHLNSSNKWSTVSKSVLWNTCLEAKSMNRFTFHQINVSNSSKIAKTFIFVLSLLYPMYEWLVFGRF